MPDPPKIWGTLELGKEGDWLQRHGQGPGRSRPDPREVRSSGGPRGNAPPGLVCHLPAGNQPISTSH